MQPVPETRSALHRVGRYVDDDLLGQFQGVASAVAGVIPSCWGVSMSLLNEGLTFTLLASDDATAELDAVQYAAGGPCVDAIQGESLVDSHDLADPSCERHWRLFAQASAARGVRSTLSLPLRVDDRIVGGYNFYASSPEAFAGHYDDVARLVRARGHEAVTNADLDFATRDRAREAPDVLDALDVIDRAVGYLAGAEGISISVARQRLESAADRAGVPRVEVARTILGGAGD